jgi:peptidoglycan L-alanyl-D-glutamate endopeptidase CwlK
MSRLLTELHPLLLNKFKLFDIECKKVEINYIVTCTHRTYAEQDALYAKGRTIPGPIVTNAKAGQSAHNVYNQNIPAACAFDIVVMDAGKPSWDVKDENWHMIGNVGIVVGLEWAGTWSNFREYPHFQLFNWRQYA